MSSVVAGGSTKPTPSKTMVISPSTEGSEEEQRIIDNFNQIQFGQRKKYGIIGTQDLSESHQNLIELLSYALVLSGNHIYTSGGSSGTNIAVIRGALRACNPDLLTVILPQSLSLQSSEMQLLLSRVANVVQLPQNDDMDLKEAANICNEKIILSVDKMVVFVYHASTSILNPLEVYQETMEFVTFYLD